MVQAAVEFSKKNPDKKIILKIIDDSCEVLEGAMRLSCLSLPENVTIEIYKHDAASQSEIVYLASVQGQKEMQTDEVLGQLKRDILAYFLRYNYFMVEYFGGFGVTYEPSKEDLAFKAAITDAKNISQIKDVLIKEKSLISKTESPFDLYWESVVKACLESVTKHDKYQAKLDKEYQMKFDEYASSIAEISFMPGG